MAKKGKKTKRKVSTTTARRSTSTKTAKKAAPRRATQTAPIRTAYNKSQILTHIAESTELTRKQVGWVFDELSGLMHRHLRKGGAGEFTVPGLVKCVVKHKPATKPRKGINPFTGEEVMFKAKPARNVVKIRALKRLKEMAQ